MQKIQNPHQSRFERSFQAISESVDLVTIGSVSAHVPANPFWRKFADGWEPDTERIYRETVKPGSVIVDIGAWIGSTLMFGLACGAQRIIALEPNPDSYNAIRNIVWQNPMHDERIHLLNRALSDEEGIVTMGVGEGETDTSTSGLAGNQFEVQTVCWETLVKQEQLTDLDLVKIDVEGAEVLLSDALAQLAEKRGQAVHLSVHVTDFPDYADIDAFVRSLESYSILDDSGERLSHKQFSDRIHTTETHPNWGTKHGNYFEVLLCSK